ncbi:MAG: hypothetical protein IKP58_02325 [Victivallales bacterium]|nr:hypothetical protein [Victivallales bacterium]
MKLKSFINNVLYISLVLLAASCVTVIVSEEQVPELRENPYKGKDKPLILAVYHPYPSFTTTVEAPVRPLPGYDGWSNNRMERDLQRMQEAGLDGVLLFVKPEDLADAIRFERIRHFYELASARQPVFRIVLVLDGNNELSTDNAAQFIKRKGLADFQCTLRLHSRPVLAFNKSIRLVRNNGMASSYFCIRHISHDWTVPPMGANFDHPAPFDGFIWVKAGDCHAAVDNSENSALSRQGTWSLPRGKGRNFANRLRKAFQEKADIICIQSWNDFTDGSFLEPNTLDNNIMLTVLRREIAILDK